jgi:hypothetical protein
MLNPSQRHLGIIQQYLAKYEINGVEFLSNMISKYCSTSTGMAATPGSNSSADNDDEPAWKKAKQEMIAKHTHVTSSTDRELQLSIVVFRPPPMTCCNGGSSRQKRFRNYHCWHKEF